MPTDDMPRGAERFVFAHPRPFWYNWLRNRRAVADRSGLYRLAGDPATVIILSDVMDPEDVELSDVPSPQLVELEELGVSSGVGSIWLSWWKRQK